MRSGSRKARFWQIGALSLASALAPAAVAACEVPASEGASPLRRAVARVKYDPETEAWQRSLPPGAIAQFVLLVDSPHRIRGRCYWPVEVRSAGELWRRYLVSANGTRLLRESDAPN